MKLKTSLLGVLMAAILVLTGIKVDAAPGGGVDWTQGSGVLTGTGVGLPPANAIGVQKKIWARQAAITDAQRRLAEAANEVRVEGETTVQMNTLVDDTIRTSVSATVKGAQIVSENWNSEGYYEVTMQVPIFGVGSLAQAVIKPVEQIPFPTPSPVQPSPTSPSTTVTVTVSGGYTGVIVDCRGLNLNPVMSPVIKDSSGVKLYGHQNLDYDMVISKGMASYAHDMSQATRAGSNPLVISAVRTEDHNANPVISVEDGNLMLLENESTGFLSNTAVVFLY